MNEGEHQVFRVDDEVYVDGWGDTIGRVVAVTVHGDIVVEHPMGETDTMPPGWLRKAPQRGFLVAYAGKEGCQSPMCRSMQNEEGEWICVGWHCAFCHEPSSYQGHVNCHPDKEAGDGW